MPFNYDSLMLECPDESNTAKFFQNCGLPHNERFCHCGSTMRPSVKVSHGSQIPVWRCPTKTCKSVKGLRPDTWFAPSTLSFHTIIKFIYWWSTEQTSIEFCKQEIDMNHNTTVDWYQLLEIFVNFKLRSLYLREACANWILRKNGKIGGPGFTVAPPKRFKC